MKKNYLIYLSFLISIFSFAQEPIKTKEAAHEGGVNAACISSDGTFVLTCGNDMKTYLWNIKTGDKLKGALKHNDKVSAIAIN